MPRRVILFLLAFFALAAPAAAQESGPPLATEVTIETAGGKDYRFEVELALTPAEQTRGLMFREEMASDAGMLFLFPDVAPRSFWMRNTLIPLDMIFIAPDGRIVSIVERAEPETLEPRMSEGPAEAVLEINGGLSQLLGIHAGDRVIHPAFAD